MISAPKWYIDVPFGCRCEYFRLVMEKNLYYTYEYNNHEYTFVNFMIGRSSEYNRILKLSRSNKFEMLIMYGRRRVGKTTILKEFFRKEKNVLFFPAQQKNDELNLTDFSEMLQSFFDGSFIAKFSDWERAFDYFSDKASNKKITLIIDEFPFLADSNPSIKSVIQHCIDHKLLNGNSTIILCGSSVSYMLNEVMGYKSPLYGRITESMEILPFDYRESAAFFENYSNEEKILSYGILGGIPRYLREFDDSKSVVSNISGSILREGSFLNDEPQIQLKMELREISVYNSIIQAISQGKNKITEISDTIHEEKSKCNKYIQVLLTLGIVKRIIPIGESDTGKKGIYVISDNFFRFWYRFISSNKTYYSMLGDERAAEEIEAMLPDYMGLVFEDICRQFFVHLAKKSELPFIPFEIGKWWGNNPAIKAQDDIDIVGLSKNKKSAFFCECKFRNSPMEMSEYDDLMTASLAFKNIENKYFYFVSKGGYTEAVKKRAKKENVILYGLNDLFRI